MLGANCWLTFDDCMHDGVGDDAVAHDDVITPIGIKLIDDDD